MASGEQVIYTGVFLVKLTVEFPEYSLKPVENDLKSHCHLISNDKLVSPRPEIPSLIEGGNLDIIVGSQYMRYFSNFV